MCFEFNSYKIITGVRSNILKRKRCGKISKNGLCRKGLGLIIYTFNKLFINAISYNLLINKRNLTIVVQNCLRVHEFQSNMGTLLLPWDLGLSM